MWHVYACGCNWFWDGAIQAEARPHRRHIWAAILLVCVCAIRAHFRLRLGQLRFWFSGFGFGFGPWPNTVIGFAMGCLFVYGLRLLAFYLGFRNSHIKRVGGFWLYLRINIYLLCYFRRFIRALHASANGIRAARIVSAIVGHRSSSPAWIAPYPATIRSTLMRYVSGYPPHTVCFSTLTLTSLLPHTESASNLVEGQYGSMSSKLIYGVFNTPTNSIPGSAVCAFALQVSAQLRLPSLPLSLSPSLSVSSYFHVLNFLAFSTGHCGHVRGTVQGAERHQLQLVASE